MGPAGVRRSAAIFAEHLPVNLLRRAASLRRGVGSAANLTPALSRLQLLWAADTIAVKQSIRLQPDAVSTRSG
jgi:hypothetical protein